jgi:predicted ATPase
MLVSISKGIISVKIKKIHISNDYKRFHDLTIDLGNNPKRIVALVGPNGCGKSSVFDALLFHNSAYGSIGNKGGKNYKYHSMKQIPNFSHENVIIEFDEGDYNTVRTQKVKNGKENTLFSFRSSYRYNSDLNVTQSQATSEIRLNDYGATTASDIDDRMEANYRRLYIKFNKFLKDNHQTATYDSAKSKIIGDLNASLINSLDLEIASMGDIEDSKGTLFFTKSDQSTEFEFNVLSSGEKEVVDILVDLYLRREEYDDSIFLIDEPELHISTAIQKKLLVEIDKMVGANCQIWIATHGIGFLRAIKEDFNGTSDIIKFDLENKWASETYTLTPVTKNRSTWLSLYSTALDDLTYLLAPNRIVYCEGRAEPFRDGSERGFDAKVYNTIFSAQYPDTVFVSSGGNTELDQRSDIALDVLSKAFLDVDIIVLKDRDMASGKDTDESDRQIYLDTNPDTHRVLRRLEVENYLFDKPVLQKYCDSIGKPFDEETYDRNITDIINQNLKDDHSLIRNICGIVGSVTFEVLKLKLAEMISEDMLVYKELSQEIFERK